jgi:inhibitor of cysteine peptidase
MAEVTLERDGAGTSLSVAPGDSVLVRLDEIPTSGYRWEVKEFDATVLQPVGDDFIPASGGAVGGGGQHEFRFRVVGPGKSELRLVRRRPWEPETAAVDELEATIDATD